MGVDEAFKSFWWDVEIFVGLLLEAGYMLSIGVFMATLPNVEKALQKAHKTLSNAQVISDLAYLIDVDPYGAECLVVYITMKDAQSLKPDAMWDIEAKLRKELSKVLSYDVYFRWATDKEVMRSRRVTTKSGLLDWPHSALLKSQ